MLDLLFKGARVVDGTGNPWYRADVGVKGKDIVAIGNLPAAEAARVIDVAGMVLAPGFIDLHTHSDCTLLVDGSAESAVHQGVTTHCVGNCGFSAAPADPADPYMRTLNPELVAGLSCNWESMAQYMVRLATPGTAINVAPLIGHGAVRSLAMGQADREPTGEEMARMRRLVEQSMEEGAFGLSTGLVYAPSSFADTPELIELTRIVARYGGFYASHIRTMNEGMDGAVSEAITIGREAGSAVQVSHMQPSPPIMGTIAALLEIVDTARSEGVDVTCDVIPYTVGMTGLKQLCPRWMMDGGNERLVERLRDPAIREKVKQDTLLYGSRTGGSSKRPLAQMGRWDKIWLASAQQSPELAGKSFAEIAELRQCDPFDAVFDILIEEGGACAMLGEDKDPTDITTAMRHGAAMVVSDGYALVPGGTLGVGCLHPRSYGTYARLIEHYVVKEQAITLEEAFQLAASRPAQRLGLRDRGQVRLGARADLIVFDPGQVHERANYADPYQYAEGFHYVMVNGTLAVDGGQRAEVRAGEVLRHA